MTYQFTARGSDYQHCAKMERRAGATLVVNAPQEGFLDTVYQLLMAR